MCKNYIKRTDTHIKLHKNISATAVEELKKQK